MWVEVAKRRTSLPCCLRKHPRVRREAGILVWRHKAAVFSRAAQRIAWVAGPLRLAQRSMLELVWAVQSGLLRAGTHWLSMWLCRIRPVPQAPPLARAS